MKNLYFPIFTTSFFKNLATSICLLSLGLLIILSSGCEIFPIKSTIRPTKVELTLKAGKKAEIEISPNVVNLNTIFDVAITPDNATDTILTWTTNDNTIATVTTNGLLTIKKEGVLKISVRAGNINSNEVEITIKPESLKINGQDTAYLGDSIYFTLTPTPQNTTTTWRIIQSGEQYGTINNNGNYKAPKVSKEVPAKAINLTLEATTTNNEKVTKQLTISIDSFPNTLKITKSNKNTYSATNNGVLNIYLGVTFIGEKTFEKSQLTSATIPNSVNTIESSAFAENQLTALIIPNTVTKIGDAAFYDNELTTVAIPNTITKLNSSVFLNNSLQTVSIPETVTIIKSGAFDGNDLKTIVIPEAVTTIESFAFRGNELTTITIPKNVTSIGINTFYFNDLTTVVMSSDLWDEIKKDKDDIFDSDTIQYKDYQGNTLVP